MKKHIPTNESGRSMVEMLGVLAIMGVLSIGAVAGYRWAVEKRSANEIVNEVKKRAVIASQQRILNRPLDLSEFDNFIQDKYAVVGNDTYEGSYFVFTLSVEGIEKGICEKVLNMDWILPVEMQLNGALVSDINTATCGETNTILYAFNNDLSPALDISGDTGETDKPTCPKGEYLDLSTGKCVKSTCPVGQFLLGAGNCVNCPTEGHSITLQSDVDDNSCTLCDGGQISGTGTNDGSSILYYACIYCPSPRIVCGNQCCAEGQACQTSGNSWSPVYTCVTAQCQSDADCADPTPLCDTFTGTCFAGCHDNTNCGSNQYCLLDTTSTGQTCTQRPERGTCQPLTTQQVGEYTTSTASMDWWSANNFCEALNMSLANLTIKCTSEEWAIIKNEGQGSCAALQLGSSSGFWTGVLENAPNAYALPGRVFYFYPLTYTFHALCE